MKKTSYTMGEKSLGIIYMNKELIARIYKISYNSVKRQIIKLKLVQNTLTDIS